MTDEQKKQETPIISVSDLEVGAPVDQQTSNTPSVDALSTPVAKEALTPREPSILNTNISMSAADLMQAAPAPAPEPVAQTPPLQNPLSAEENVPASQIETNTYYGVGGLNKREVEVYESVVAVVGEFGGKTRTPSGNLNIYPDISESLHDQLFTPQERPAPITIKQSDLGGIGYPFHIGPVTITPQVDPFNGFAAGGTVVASTGRDRKQPVIVEPGTGEVQDLAFKHFLEKSETIKDPIRAYKRQQEILNPASPEVGLAQGASIEVAARQGRVTTGERPDKALNVTRSDPADNPLANVGDTEAATTDVAAYKGFEFDDVQSNEPPVANTPEQPQAKEKPGPSRS